MQEVLLSSVVVRAIALAWSGVYLYRTRNRRMALLSLLLILVAIEDAQNYQRGMFPNAEFSLLTSLVGLLLVVLMGRTARLATEASNATSGYSEAFRAIAENAPDFIWALDPQGRYVYASPSVREMFGFTPDELIGQYAFDPEYVTVPDGPQDLERWLRETIRGGAEHTQLSLKQRRRDGTEILTDVHVSMSRDQRGILRGIYGVTRDITVYWETDQALRESEQQHRLLAENATDCIWTSDITGRYTYVSPAVQHVLGYTPEELLGRSLHKLLPDSERDSVMALIAEGTMGERDGARLEMQLVTKSGSLTWVEVSVSVMRDDAGNVSGMQGITRDISKRKAAEADVAFRLEFEQLIAGISLGLVDMPREEIDAVIEHALGRVAEFLGADAGHLLNFDEDQQVGVLTHRWTEAERSLPIGWSFDFNDAPWALERLHREEIVRVSPGQLPPAEAAELRAWMSAQRLGGVLAVPISQGSRLNGCVFFTQGTLATEPSPAWSDASTDLLRSLGGIFRTALGRKEAQEHGENLASQLLQAQKMEAVGTLAGGIAHDFNNLLTGILGGIQLGLMEMPAESRSARSLRQAQEAAERAAELTKQLLTISRKQDANLGPMDINEAVHSTVRLLNRSISETIDLRVMTDPSIPTLAGDSGQLGQALLNLGINARDAIGDGGRMLFETEIVTVGEDCKHIHPNARPGRFVVISVSDSGEGIPEDKLEHIFEPFFTTKEQGKGTGLGLAMVYGCMQAHHGWVSVYSEVGKGTRFSLYLPLIEAHMDERLAPSSDVPYGNETILLVDDTDAILFLGRAMLERCGYTVLTAWNGAEAIRTYESQPHEIDLVVTDFVMPQAGGRELLAGLRELGSDVPVILTSGYAVDQRPTDLLAEGFAEFVPKPFDLHILARTVRRILDKSQTELESFEEVHEDASAASDRW